MILKKKKKRTWTLPQGLCPKRGFSVVTVDDPSNFLSVLLILQKKKKRRRRRKRKLGNGRGSWGGHETTQNCVCLCLFIIGSAEALPVLCVRCVRWEIERYREREKRERDTERDGSDVTLVALKLAINFAPFLAKRLKLAMNFEPFLAKNLHLSIGEEFCTFPCQKFAP